MRVQELSGALLDYWVAKAEGIRHAHINHDAEPPYCYMWESESGMCSGDIYAPSSKWAHGGPIIEREEISVLKTNARECWLALVRATWSYDGPESSHEQEGNTPLTASMRAYVASKFGEEVPEEV